MDHNPYLYLACAAIIDERDTQLMEQQSKDPDPWFLDPAEEVQELSF